jgi:hypothetical protein
VHKYAIIQISLVIFFFAATLEMIRRQVPIWFCAMTGLAFLATYALVDHKWHRYNGIVYNRLVSLFSELQGASWARYQWQQSHPDEPRSNPRYQELLQRECLALAAARREISLTKDQARTIEEHKSWLSAQLDKQKP